MDPTEFGLGLLLDTLALSAKMRQSDDGESAQGPQGHLMTKEELLWPLLSPEFMPPHVRTPLWCGSPKSHFGGLLQEIYHSWRDVAGHVVIPLLIPTFRPFRASSPALGLEAVPSVHDDLKIFSEIQTNNICGQFSLRKKMKEHLSKITDKIPGADGQVLSVLHIHVDMKQDHAQEIVDYLRFQIEWFARELANEIKRMPDGAAVHVLAIVVHAVRGCEQDHSIRPFLFAGPCLRDHQDPASVVKVFPWTGVAVDHLSHLLPWGIRPEELSTGTIKEIYGLEEEDTCRFRLILADSLPRVVPRFAPHSDSFAIVQTLNQEIGSKPELVRCIRAVLCEQLSREQLLLEQAAALSVGV